MLKNIAPPLTFKRVEVLRLTVVQYSPPFLRWGFCYLQHCCKNKYYPICALYNKVLYVCVIKLKHTIMTIELTQSEMTQKVKNFIVRRAYNSGHYRTFADLSDLAEAVIYRVANGNFGFATEIAITCEKFRKVSEKQSYWIAKIAVENNAIGQLEFLLEQE